MRAAKEEVAVATRGYVEAVGSPFHFVARLYWPGLAFDRQVRAMRTFVEEAVPFVARHGGAVRAER